VDFEIRDRGSMIVALDGVIALRSSMKENQPPLPTRSWSTSSTSGRGKPEDSPLHCTYCKQMRPNDESVEAADEQQAPHLVFIYGRAAYLRQQRLHSREMGTKSIATNST
jgi:hypothetical protein